MQDLFKEASDADKETGQVEFKESFDIGSPAHWCEVIKDIVALANSGGGTILVGVDNDGRPTHSDVSKVLALDSAVICDKIHSYTEVHFSDLDIHSLQKSGATVAAVRIGPAQVPLVFVKPGTYAVSEKKQASAFSQGTVYFRHGPKSEPGVSEDIRQVIERRLADIRTEWLSGVTKVVHAPEGSAVSILPRGVRLGAQNPETQVRIVDDLTAPAFGLVDRDVTHPYRQNDVVARLRGMKSQLGEINSYDILAVRKVHKVEEMERFFYKPKFGSPQYSDSFIEWLAKRHSEDSAFFAKARALLKSANA
jgi:hypothetical protein